MEHWQELVTFAQRKTAQIVKKHCRVICSNQMLKNEFARCSLRVLDAVYMLSKDKMALSSKTICHKKVNVRKHFNFK